jgi:serine/threonine-protein kinase
MSPEQLNDEAVDGRSDLFSLGVILYTMLTGYRPFQGNSAMTVAFKVVNRDPIPATILDTELPPGFDYIISRAIAKDPSQRYQRGMEMALDIQDLREGREPWSKAKHPDSAPAAAQTQNDKTKHSSLNELTRGATQKSKSRALPFEHGAAQDLLENLRKKSLAGIILFAGLLIFGIRMGYFIWPQQTSSQKVAGTQPVSSPSVAADPAPLKPIAPVVALKRRKPSSRSRRSAPRLLASSVSGSQAMLEIEIDHNFSEAHMAIWVDDQLTYTHPLAGIEKKHLVLFRRVQGHEFHAVQILPGKHLLRVQVSPGAGASEQSGTVEGEFAGGTERMLRIQFGKGGEMTLSLE